MGISLTTSDRLNRDFLKSGGAVGAQDVRGKEILKTLTMKTKSFQIKQPFRKKAFLVIED